MDSQQSEEMALARSVHLRDAEPPRNLQEARAEIPHGLGCRAVYGRAVVQVDSQLTQICPPCSRRLSPGSMQFGRLLPRQAGFAFSLSGGCPVQSSYCPDKLGLL